MDEYVKFGTKNGAEVDFAIDDATPVEIKSHLASLKISKSYHYFLENYTPKRGYVLNFDQIGSKVLNGAKIDFLPHFHGRSFVGCCPPTTPWGSMVSPMTKSHLCPSSFLAIISS